MAMEFGHPLHALHARTFQLGGAMPGLLGG
jgi:hypothetical protein